MKKHLFTSSLRYSKFRAVHKSMRQRSILTKKIVEVIHFSYQNSVTTDIRSKDNDMDNSIFSLEDVSKALEKVRQEGFVSAEALYARNKIMNEFGWDMNLLPTIEKKADIPSKPPLPLSNGPKTS